MPLVCALLISLQSPSLFAIQKKRCIHSQDQRQIKAINVPKMLDIHSHPTNVSVENVYVLFLSPNLGGSKDDTRNRIVGQAAAREHSMKKRTNRDNMGHFLDNLGNAPI